MTQQHAKPVVEHIPVIGQPSTHADERVVLVLDAATGRRIGHSPTHNVEQTRHQKNKDGTITTTFKITHVRDTP